MHIRVSWLGRPASRVTVWHDQGRERLDDDGQGSNGRGNSVDVYTGRYGGDLERD